MKKAIILILVLILSFVGFKYWQKSQNKLNSSDTQTSLSKKSIDDESISKRKGELPCFEPAMKDLLEIEITKQESQMCGQQKRFNLYFDSPLTKSVYAAAKKCLYDVGLYKGYTTYEAKEYAEEDFVPEIVTKIHSEKMNKDRAATCSALNVEFTELGF